jgi:FkbM family methyltransferase
MEFSYIGTDYGGWAVALDLIPEGSTIISAGVGEDISFDLGLIEKKSCKIIGIDPTQKSHQFIEASSPINNFQLIKKALHSVDGDVIALYKNRNPQHVSESILPSHGSVMNYDYHYAETVSLESLFEKYENISLVKMDIEGSEYPVLETLKSIPSAVQQLCIEFHHFCTNHSLEDTKRILNHLEGLGFSKIVQNKPNSYAELTLVR